MTRKATTSPSPGSFPVGLAKPAQRALVGADIHNLEQLSRFSEAEICQLHGIGPNALDKLRRSLAENGLSFANVERKLT
jgi:hypothetical protein